MNNWKEIIASLVLFAGITTLILVTKKNEQLAEPYLTSIPKRTKVHLLINANYVLKELLITELFESKDEFVIEKIKELSRAEKIDKPTIKDLSINIFEPVEYLSFESNSQIYTAIKFKIVNNKVFDKSKRLKVSNVGLIRNKNTGYIVFSKGNLEEKLLKNLLLKNCLRLQLTNDFKSHYFTFFKNSKEKYNGKIELLRNEIIVHTKSMDNITKNSMLKPNGFHVSSTVNLSSQPGFDQFTVLKYFSAENINFLSLNYFGLEIKEKSLLPAIPKMDLLLSYSSKINLDSLVENFSKVYGVEFNKSSNNTYFLENLNVHLNQYSSNKIYLSTTTNKLVTQNSSSPIFLSGDANNLVKIENAGWKSLFLELIPLFKSSKNFLGSTKQIATEQVNKNEQKITLKFKNHVNSLHEILAFILHLQV